MQVHMPSSKNLFVIATALNSKTSFASIISLKDLKMKKTYLQNYNILQIVAL